MKKINYISLLILTATLILACTDESLDPLNFNKVKKGSILVLRGTQLQNIYFDGTPGAEFFPRIINGSEKFEFDAEFLSEDPTLLSSVDVYVIKRTKVGTSTTSERVLVTNIPASDFKTTSDYVGPWATISIPLTTILQKLGLDHTIPADVATLLDVYKFGVSIESDVNLTNGTKIAASDLVAAGLYQSNQFYPAQKLTYAVTDFCSYNAASWAGDYGSREVYDAGVYPSDGSLYDVTLTPDPSDPNKFTMDNFWDYGLEAVIEFSPSSGPSSQSVKFPDQVVDGVELTTISGSYDQCLGTFQIQVKYGEDEWRYEFTKK